MVQWHASDSIVSPLCVQELGISHLRCKHFWGCVCLQMCRKLLGEAAWRECVGRCDTPAAINMGARCTWSNMELLYFGIDV